MKRETLLNKLILDLAEMIALLGKDPSCRWAKKFESDLIAAKSVALSPIDPNAYASLSASISDDEMLAIRTYLQQQRALGHDAFKAMVEAKTRRFAGIRPAHRPRRK